jgi:SAM-dependent methyltransferase
MGRVEQNCYNRERLLYKFLSPPLPLFHNPREKLIEKTIPTGRWNLYVGGAGNSVPGYVNVDLFDLPGVDVVCSVERLPFKDSIFTRVECDAVLEHVARPEMAVSEIRRCLINGGVAHFVVPFCHPFHEYPRDFRRYTPDGMAQLLSEFHVIDEGWRTGPTATWLVFTLEYAKLWFRSRWLKRLSYLLLGWMLFPLRYFDVLLLRKADARQIGNHYYVYAKKESATGEPSTQAS